MTQKQKCKILDPTAPYGTSSHFFLIITPSPYHLAESDTLFLDQRL